MSFKSPENLCVLKLLQPSLTVTAQWTQDVMITWLLRQNDVTTSFWRNNDVIIALRGCLEVDLSNNKIGTPKLAYVDVYDVCIIVLKWTVL